MSTRSAQQGQALVGVLVVMTLVFLLAGAVAVGTSTLLAYQQGPARAVGDDLTAQSAVAEAVQKELAPTGNPRCRAVSASSLQGVQSSRQPPALTAAQVTAAAATGPSPSPSAPVTPHAAPPAPTSPSAPASPSPSAGSSPSPAASASPSPRPSPGPSPTPVPSVTPSPAFIDPLPAVNGGPASTLAPAYCTAVTAASVDVHLLSVSPDSTGCATADLQQYVSAGDAGLWALFDVRWPDGGVAYIADGSPTSPCRQRLPSGVSSGCGEGIAPPAGEVAQVALSCSLGGVAHPTLFVFSRDREPASVFLAAEGGSGSAGTYYLTVAGTGLGAGKDYEEALLFKPASPAGPAQLRYEAPLP